MILTANFIIFIASYAFIISWNEVVIFIFTIFAYLIIILYVVLLGGGILVFLFSPIIEAISEYLRRPDCPKCNKRRVGVATCERDNSVNNAIRLITTTICKKCNHLINTEENEYQFPEKTKPNRNRAKSNSKYSYSRSSGPSISTTTTKPQTTTSAKQKVVIPASVKPETSNDSILALGHSPSNSQIESAEPASPPIIKSTVNQQPIIMSDLIDKNNAWVNREIGVVTRQALPETRVVLLHGQIQRELTYCLLRTNTPGRFVYNEFECIDILVEDTNCFTLIEIKTSLCAMTNIRDAIGQLLEYQFMSRLELKGKRNSLLVVSPAKLTTEACDYVNHLSSLYSIAIDYRKYVPGSFLFLL